MYGLFGGEKSKHMLPVSVSSTTLDAIDSSNPYFFSKDGRKIRVGDCALFEPPLDSPPFIGIIRRLTLDKEERLCLSVNWLYRAADIKLGKGILLEAALNEVFFSFHKDEIPAASLLHPCKVAFLHKGVELPAGISSFVCRRVYDIENKRLWWLTDKDYINERQEVVDQLLDKTRLEMHGALQSGGRSPKSPNAQTSGSQLKTALDSVQNSSFSSHAKGKKRALGDQGSDSTKRERLTKTDDVDSGLMKHENIMKHEIAKITDKGGLVDLEGVEKLVKLMQLDSPEKKIDLPGRILLVDVIAMTDRSDCLGRFVQLKGLPILDEWLQEVHRGKIGDCSISKEHDKLADELLFTALRALEKLPVNLHALQTCNIGKSVNHLRSHRNFGIQRKARGLVDTWKKRVEAEMNISDAKSGSSRGVSWTTKSVPFEASQAGSRKIGGTSEIDMKPSSTQPSAAKIPQPKSGVGESVAKLSASPGTTKSSISAGVISKEPSGRMMGVTGNSEQPLTPVKEGRSSSSGQSQNNSQSCSSDRVKTAGSCPEDARCSTAGSGHAHRISSGSSHRRKSSNGLLVSTSEVQKENGTGKVNANHQNLISGKASQTGVSHEKSPEVSSRIDRGNPQRLIVKFSNASRSPLNVEDGSLEDPNVRGSIVSPSREKHDEVSRKMKGKTDACWISSSNADVSHGKDVLAGGDEGNVVAHFDERGRADENYQKSMEVSKDATASSSVISRPERSYDASLSPMNALIESCVKFSEVSASSSPGDDVGMNLLASVATAEISKYEAILPLDCPGKDPPADEGSGDDFKSNQLVKEVTKLQCRPNYEENAAAAGEQGDTVDVMHGENEQKQSITPLSTKFLGDKTATFGSGERTVEYSEQLSVSPRRSQENVNDSCMRSEANPIDAEYSLHAKKEGDMEVEGANRLHEQRKPGTYKTRSRVVSDSQLNISTSLNKVEQWGEKTVDSNATVVTTNAKVEIGADREPLCSSSEAGGGETRICPKRAPSNAILTDKKPTLTTEVHTKYIEREGNDAILDSGSGLELGIMPKVGKTNNDKARYMVEVKSEQQMEGRGSTISGNNGECAEENFEHSKACGESEGILVFHTESSTTPVQENKSIMRPSTVKKVKTEAEGKEINRASGSNVLPSVGPDAPVKLDFDLNEGFLVDDGTQRDVGKSTLPQTSKCTDHFPCPLPFSVSSIPGNHPVSITVATAAKGPFVPPENPLRSKGELGWKGSAATSAFRPAEPRKNPEILNTTDIPAAGAKPSRVPFDFDLNVPDETAIEDVASLSSVQLACSESGARECGAGGLDLDLNMIDENAAEVGMFPINNYCRLEIPSLPNGPALSSRLSNDRVNVFRGFDLNNGPTVDEAGSEAAPLGQYIKASVPFHSPGPALKMNNPEFGFASWFTQGNSYPAITVPSMFHGRGEQSYLATSGSQRIVGPTGSSSSAPEIYRGPAGPVLSSSPAVAYPPGTPFQYPGFPFETSFPLSDTFSGNSTAYMDSSSSGPIFFPAIPAQVVGPRGVLSSSYPRPHLMNLPGGTSNVAPESKKWGSQGFDLNSGPGGTDTERRDERLPLGLRQLSTPSSQSLAEEQLKIYQVAVGGMKRREPNDGRDPVDRFGYKQP